MLNFRLTVTNQVASFCTKKAISLIFPLYRKIIYLKVEKISYVATGTVPVVSFTNARLSHTKSDAANEKAVIS